MKRIKSFSSSSLLLLVWLASLSPTPLRPVRAQAEPPITAQFPGLPPGYTLIEGDIQIPIEQVKALRAQKPFTPAAPQSTFENRLWPNGIIPYRFETACAATSTCTGVFLQALLAQGVCNRKPLY